MTRDPIRNTSTDRWEYRDGDRVLISFRAEGAEGYMDENRIPLGHRWEQAKAKAYEIAVARMTGCR